MDDLELGTKLRNKKADMNYRLNHLTVKLEEIRKKIEHKKENIYVFKPEEVERLFNNLAIEILMADSEDMLKIIGDVEANLKLSEDSEGIIECPYKDECSNCINSTNHCNNFEEDHDGRNKCFNYKTREAIVIVKAPVEEVFEEFKKRYLKNKKTSPGLLVSHLRKLHPGYTVEELRIMYDELKERYKDQDPPS